MGETLPTILTPEEMTRLIDSSKNLFHYAMLLNIYSCGLRRSELCRLKVGNIDSQRMGLRVDRDNGGVDRKIPLNQKLPDTLSYVLALDAPEDLLVSGY